MQAYQQFDVDIDADLMLIFIKKKTPGVVFLRNFKKNIACHFI